MIRPIVLMRRFRSISIFLACLLVAAAQASDLTALRLSLSPERTRFVFEMDAAVPYQVNFSDNSVDIVFSSLKVSRTMLEDARDSLGGLVDNISYNSRRNESAFHLNVTGPFYLRYFDLVKPARVVIDLYPKPNRPVPEVLAQSPPPPRPIPKIEPKATQTEKDNAQPLGQDQTTPRDQEIKAPIKSTPSQDTSQARAQSSNNPFPWLYVALPLAVIAGLMGAAHLKKRRRRVVVPVTRVMEGEVFVRVLEQEKTRLNDQEIQPIESKTQESAPVPMVAAPAPKEPTLAEIPHPEAPIMAEVSPPEVPVAPEVSPLEEPITLEIPPLEETMTMSVPIPNEPITTDIPVPEEPVIAEVRIPKEPIAVEMPPPKVPEPVEIPAELPVPEIAAEALIEEPTLEIAAEALLEEPASELSLADIKAELVAAFKATHSQEPVQPEFHPEDGLLIWPVHLLDGGRLGRLLVVDDDADVVKPVVEYLQREGYEVQGSTSSRKGIDLYWEFRPDLLILDVLMPELSGVDMVKELREKEKPHKVIFLSGKMDRENVTAAFFRELNKGQYEFFRKPVELRQIGDRVKDYFRSASDVLHLNVQNQKFFSSSLAKLGPHQLTALHHFVWDKVFETSAGLLGRRIEPFFITDRMEPAPNYMRQMGCMERMDYCKASVCINSNPLCASNRLRYELEIMRGILEEFRSEYVTRLGRGIGAEDLRPAKKKRKVKNTV